MWTTFIYDKFDDIVNKFSFFPLASRHFKEKMQQQAKKDEASWRLLVSKVISAKNSLGPFSSRHLLFYDLLYEMHLVYSKECEVINKASWICWGKMN